MWPSLLRRGLLQSRWVETRGGCEEEKFKACGERWEGERKKGGFVWFSGRICGSVVLAKLDDDLDDFECPFKDLSIEG